MDGSITIRPFDAFIYRLAEDISKDKFSRMLDLSGSLESSPITTRDREKIEDPYQLLKKMEHYDHINDTKCDVLVNLLKKADRNDLALEVEVRYIIGFDHDISREELQGKVEAHQQKVLACSQKDMTGAGVAKTVKSARITESTGEVAESLKSGETAVTDDSIVMLQSTESGEVIEGVTSHEEKEYYTDANKVESWLMEKMASVCIDEYGKNTQGAKALLVKHVRLEEEIAAYEGNINKLGEQAQFVMSMDSKNPASQMEREAELVDLPYEVEETHIEEKVIEREFVIEQKLPKVKAVYAYKGRAGINDGATHLDKESVEMRQQAINKAYKRLCKLAKARHGYLEDVIKVYSFYKECDDFEYWMIEKERALQRKESHLHKMEIVTREFSYLLTDLMTNTSRFDKINEMADEFIKTNHSQRQVMMDRQKDIQKKWEEVNQLREAKLSYSMKLYSQAWDERKRFILKKISGLGDNDDIMQIKQQNVIEALVMEHQNLEKELALEKENMATLEMLAKAIRISYPRETEIVASKQREIKELWESLLDKVLDRKPRLNAAHSICQFHVDAKDPKFQNFCLLH
ncbi:spectrin alpha chain-like [Ptychodera flava]|uniref:spectrin alpha chain-like n=1 Tax=Ptychodera flava TaxID=63121 RepID=UPI00396A4A2B